MELIFCPICGAKTEKKAKGQWYCPNCRQDYYVNPNPAVEVAFFNEEGKVLLAERGEEPSKGKWDLPGGFIDLEESAETALVREIKEELELNPGDYAQPKFVRSYEAKYPWGKVTYDIVVFMFVARIKPGVILRAQDDVASVKWIKPEDIDKTELSNENLDQYILECKAALESMK